MVMGESKVFYIGSQYLAVYYSGASLMRVNFNTGFVPSYDWIYNQDRDMYTNVLYTIKINSANDLL